MAHLSFAIVSFAPASQRQHPGDTGYDCSRATTDFAMDPSSTALADQLRPFVEVPGDCNMCTKDGIALWGSPKDVCTLVADGDNHLESMPDLDSFCKTHTSDADAEGSDQHFKMCLSEKDVIQLKKLGHCNSYDENEGLLYCGLIARARAKRARASVFTSPDSS